MLSPNQGVQTQQCTYPNWVKRSDCRHCRIFKQVIFSDLSPEDLSNIADGISEPIDEFTYETGMAMYVQDGVDNAVYTIREGMIKLVRYASDGSERIMRLARTTDSIGLERLLGKPYGHTAIALGKVQACRIPIGVLQHLDEEKPRFYRQLMVRWAAGLFQADDYIMLLLSGSVKERVAHLVRWLAGMTLGRHDNRLKMLSGKDMAAMLDVSVESVSRIIAEMKRRGILAPLGNETYRFDPRALEEFLAGD